MLYEEIKAGIVRAAGDDADGGGALRDAAPTIASVVARGVTVVAVAPMELVRTQRQFARSRLSVWRTLRRMAATEGYAAQWRGVTASLARDIPFAGVYWTAYEAWRPALVRELFPLSGGGGGGAGSGAGENFVAAFVAGWSAGLLAAAVTTPLDVVKTRRQVGVTATASSARGYSVLRELGAIAAAEGPRGLFSGLGPRLAKVGPTCAIMISSYELGKQYLNVSA